MIRPKANSKRALLGVAAAVFSLFLADGALVSAGHNEGTAPAGLVQAVQASAQMALQGSIRFANDMRAVYQLSHLDQIVPTASESPAPAQDERAKLLLCTESRPLKAAPKASI